MHAGIPACTGACTKRCAAQERVVVPICCLCPAGAGSCQRPQVAPGLQPLQLPDLLATQPPQREGLKDSTV